MGLALLFLGLEKRQVLPGLSKGESVLAPVDCAMELPPLHPALWPLPH